MYRIGIIGSENSHAMAFSKIYNGESPESRALDCRVVAVMGEEAEASQKVFAECGLEFIAAHPEDMLGKVDAVMVTSRSGALHLKYAKPFLTAGLPVFVDKPVANDPAEALEIVRLAKISGSPIMGGSSTKLVADTLALKAQRAEWAEKGIALGGCVWAPLSMDNPYGGFFFYSSHLVEICLAIFGYSPKAVMATKSAVGIDALLEYEDSAVSLHFMEGVYHYGCTLLSKEGAVMKTIDISDCYWVEAMQFAEMLKTGQSSISYLELIQPVYVLDAIERAYRMGERQEIELPEV